MHTILVLEDDIELNNTICCSLEKMVIELWELELVKKQKTTQIVISSHGNFGYKFTRR